jgi:hypothetical protein
MQNKQRTQSGRMRLATCEVMFQSKNSISMAPSFDNLSDVVHTNEIVARGRFSRQLGTYSLGFVRMRAELLQCSV